MIRIISHNDLDGYGCTILVKKVFGETNVKASNITNFREDQYLKYFEDDMKTWDDYDIIFITDLSLPKSVLELITAYTEKRMQDIDINIPVESRPYPVYYVDHHKSSNSLEYYIKNYPWYVKVQSADRFEVNMPHCGASLLYTLFDEMIENGRFDNTNILPKKRGSYGISIKSQPSEFKTLDIYLGWRDSISEVVYINNFIDYVRLWDTFQWVDWSDLYGKIKSANDAVRLNRIFKSVPHTYFEESILHCPKESMDLVFPGNIENYVDQTHIYQLNHMKQRIESDGIDIFINGTNEEDDLHIRPYEGMSVNDTFSWKGMLLVNYDDISLAREIVIDSLGYDILLIWNPIAGLINIRVSDTCNFDASKFAAARGGGGHKKAAGIKYDVRSVNGTEHPTSDPKPEAPLPLRILYLDMKATLLNHI